ncbi:outer membrane beta-barrel protein [Ferrovum sp. PN-J185]|uniref:OmpW/AlkL family protein n=1 Tax=Ferrovum sp. PN-J185 TaxID=1356306 RepID=UPI001E45442B|nr:OmpW family outer membrane protein [Ferrovum sp. PN-J185]MCC6068086.1 outer membrane beta-barrel protein [Ferrovum sp. PN-J185]
MKHIVRKTVLASVITAMGISMAYADQQGTTPWLVRVRLLDIATQKSNDSGLAGGVAADSMQVGGRLQPDVDVTYFFNPHWAAELVLSYPVSHSVSLNGGNIGSFQELPPTLNAQYHFDSMGKFTPYVGAGLTYMRTFNTNLISGLGLTQNNFGPDVEVGLDYALDQHWSLNADIKQVFINVGVTNGAGGTFNLHPDPTLFGVGVGYHF